jgi:hypothetical protein
MNALGFSLSPPPLSDWMGRQAGKCIAVLYVMNSLGEGGMSAGRHAIPHRLHHIPHSPAAPTWRVVMRGGGMMHAQATREVCRSLCCYTPLLLLLLLFGRGHGRCYPEISVPDP